MTSKKICRAIKESIKDERKGVFDYCDLSSNLIKDNHQHQAITISRIAKDEADHEMKLRKMAKTLGCK